MIIMDKNHPLWEEFCEDLEFSVFNHRGESMCDHTTEITRSVLKTYYGVDVEASLEAFHLLGGFCDCEIIYNTIN
jgi:hypothetical protein